MKHFLVTGALGYIGSKFISLLNDEYYNLKLTLIDNLSTSRFAPVVHLNETIEYDFIEMNLLDIQLDEIYPAIDCVIHLATNTIDEDNTFCTPQIYNEENIHLLDNVARFCSHFKIPLIHISTHLIEQIDQLSSHPHQQRLAHFVRVKHEEEKLLNDYFISHQLKAISIRPGHILGASSGMNFRDSLNYLIWQAVFKQRIEISKEFCQTMFPITSLTDMANFIKSSSYHDEINSPYSSILSYNILGEQFIKTLTDRISPLIVDTIDSQWLLNEDLPVSDKNATASQSYDFTLLIHEMIDWLEEAKEKNPINIEPSPN